MQTRAAGFTLIELIVVMAIVGLFASMSAPTFQKYIQTSRMNQAGEVISVRLAEAYSASRSTRDVRIVRGVSDADVVQIISCPQVVDPLTNEITCADNCEKIEDENLSTDKIDLVSDFDVRYFPPHGDVQVVVPGTPDTCERQIVADTVPSADITLQNDGGAATLRVHGLTGLVEPLGETLVTPDTP